MATTSSNLVAGKAIAAGKAAQGGNGKGNRGRAGVLVATAALGLSLVIGGIVGQARQPESAGVPQASSVTTEHDSFVPDPFTYREDRRSESAPVQAVDTFVPDPFTYREDRRAERAPAWTPDPFTYREDRRER
jgi:hypothetical protein